MALAATFAMTEPRVTQLRVHAFRVPTDGPDGMETDGTLSWESTTVIVVEVSAAGTTGIGYTYGDSSVATFIRSQLAPLVLGSDPCFPATIWSLLCTAIRNAGRPGVGSMAIAAVDIALWDLKARLLDMPLFALLPAHRIEVPVYGSGGFTNYPIGRLIEQLTRWVARGIPRVKLKTSRNPERDPERISAVRAEIGDDPELMVDANGALSRKQARYWAERFADEWRITWFEEPVSSADLDGLRWLREHGPPGMDITAGEYGFVLRDFHNLLEAGAVDCLQADVTRCGGITGLLEVAAHASGWQTDISAHCAPAVSAHAFCAVRQLRHLEYFHDHARTERLLFDGTLLPDGGFLRPDPNRIGLGLAIRWQDAERYRI
ncbi:enolase C-terminal domain-like protein [Sciscionella sediminilitoris]|uniref:enolase C-terminal domain-like protein n=1 Tax=Sciscionella sediminilitoris TaxID=1445613 RepID=UPI000AA5AD6B|nr:enolase C-terminal domain-like protein [Sciscionella sp. SE31]